VTQLVRRLGTFDAVVLGLGAMLGAGVFAAFAPAARAGGSLLLIGLALAAIVAYCNATASAQLAAAYPTSGGTYVYGRERLGEWWGYIAGWGFVAGKTASCAAMALTFAAYAAPAGWAKPVGVAAVVALVAVNYFGVTKTARVARIIVTIVLMVLALVSTTGLVSAPPHPYAAAGPFGVLQAAGLLFFAFAGYARIATMGEEVVEPRRTIPRAILLALAVAVAVYALVALALLNILGAQRLADSTAPLADAVAAAGWTWAGPIVRFGAACASLGALLALIAGIGRTTLAMARNDDLPRWLSAVHPRFHVPHRAEVVIGAIVCALVLTVDLRGAIGFSSFGVLVYYLIANVSAYTQSGPDRLYPKALQVLGAIGCATLAITLPWQAVGVGAAVLAAGCAIRLFVTWRRRPS
jgi:APA family basic amino acid/polyamine antiporter